MTTKQREREDAIRQLRDLLKPGDTVHTILDHVSRSGMMRAIRCVVMTTDDRGRPIDLHPNYLISKAIDVPQITRNGRRQDALKMTGCGMDMGFQLVHLLGYALYPDGFTCTGTDCPSNDHSNGDRDHTPHQHSSGGYALRQRWL